MLCPMTNIDQLLQPGDLAQAGVYWYFDEIGGQAQVVEVGDEDVPRGDWEVQFPGRADADSLREMSGFFIGPLPRPERPRS